MFIRRYAVHDTRYTVFIRHKVTITVNKQTKGTADPRDAHKVSASMTYATAHSRVMSNSYVQNTRRLSHLEPERDFDLEFDVRSGDRDGRRCEPPTPAPFPLPSLPLCMLRLLPLPLLRLGERRRFTRSPRLGLSFLLSRTGRQDDGERFRRPLVFTENIAAVSNKN